MREYRKILAVYGNDPGISDWIAAFRRHCPDLTLVIVPAKEATYSRLNRESTALVHGIPRPAILN